MADGGLIEPIPFQSAIEEGATHGLVLRSRPAAYRKPALSELGQVLALHDDPRLVEVLKARAGVYNRQADELEQGHPGRKHGTHILQIAVPDHVRLIGRLETFHGGLGGPQTKPFILYPAELPIPDQPIVGAAGVHALLTGWRSLLRAAPQTVGETGDDRS